MFVEKPHFELSPHGCAGCAWVGKLHYGCVVDGSARRAEDGGKKVKQEEPPTEELVIEKPSEN